MLGDIGLKGPCLVIDFHHLHLQKASCLNNPQVHPHESISHPQTSQNLMGWGKNSPYNKPEVRRRDKDITGHLLLVSQVSLVPAVIEGDSLG